MTVSGMMVAMSRCWQHKTLLKKQEFTGLFHRGHIYDTRADVKFFF